jgi:hypothetical protein
MPRRRDGQQWGRFSGTYPIAIATAIFRGLIIRDKHFPTRYLGIASAEIRQAGGDAPRVSPRDPFGIGPAGSAVEVYSLQAI